MAATMAETMDMQPFCFGARDGSVIIETLAPDSEGSADDDVGLSGRLIIGREDTLTLLMTAIAAIRDEGDREKIDAARRQCVDILGVE
jgi:hypothetical protein